LTAAYQILVGQFLLDCIDRLLLLVGSELDVAIVHAFMNRAKREKANSEGMI
jgi:hypothetical protein